MEYYIPQLTTFKYKIIKQFNRMKISILKKINRKLIKIIDDTPYIKKEIPQSLIALVRDAVYEEDVSLNYSLSTKIVRYGVNYVSLNQRMNDLNLDSCIERTYPLYVFNFLKEVQTNNNNFLVVSDGLIVTELENEEGHVKIHYFNPQNNQNKMVYLNEFLNIIGRWSKGLMLSINSSLTQ